MSRNYSRRQRHYDVMSFTSVLDFAHLWQSPWHSNASCLFRCFDDSNGEGAQ